MQTPQNRMTQACAQHIRNRYSELSRIEFCNLDIDSDVTGQRLTGNFALFQRHSEYHVRCDTIDGIESIATPIDLAEGYAVCFHDQFDPLVAQLLDTSFRTNSSQCTGHYRYPIQALRYQVFSV